MRSKASAALFAGAMAVGSVMFSAPVASAAVACSSSGYTPSNEPMERCTSLSNGTLYHKKAASSTGTAIYTTYSKEDGTAVSVRLGYSMGGSTVYSSYFTISSGQTVKKTFSKSGDYVCSSSIGLLNYSGGTFQTPSAHC